MKWVRVQHVEAVLLQACAPIAGSTQTGGAPVHLLRVSRGDVVPVRAVSSPPGWLLCENAAGQTGPVPASAAFIRAPDGATMPSASPGMHGPAQRPPELGLPAETLALNTLMPGLGTAVALDAVLQQAAGSALYSAPLGGLAHAQDLQHVTNIVAEVRRLIHTALGVRLLRAVSSPGRAARAMATLLCAAEPGVYSHLPEHALLAAAASALHAAGAPAADGAGLPAGLARLAAVPLGLVVRAGAALTHALTATSPGQVHAVSHDGSSHMHAGSTSAVALAVLHAAAAAGVCATAQGLNTGDAPAALRRLLQHPLCQPPGSWPSVVLPALSPAVLAEWAWAHQPLLAPSTAALIQAESAHVTASSIASASTALCDHGPRTAAQYLAAVQERLVRASLVSVRVALPMQPADAGIEPLECWVSLLDSATLAPFTHEWLVAMYPDGHCAEPKRATAAGAAAGAPWNSAPPTLTARQSGTIEFHCVPAAWIATGRVYVALRVFRLGSLRAAGPATKYLLASVHAQARKAAAATAAAASDAQRMAKAAASPLATPLHSSRNLLADDDADSADGGDAMSIASDTGSRVGLAGAAVGATPVLQEHLLQAWIPMPTDAVICPDVLRRPLGQAVAQVPAQLLTRPALAAAGVADPSSAGLRAPCGEGDALRRVLEASEELGGSSGSDDDTWAPPTAPRVWRATRTATVHARVMQPTKTDASFAQAWRQLIMETLAAEAAASDQDPATTMYSSPMGILSGSEVLSAAAGMRSSAPWSTADRFSKPVRVALAVRITPSSRLHAVPAAIANMAVRHSSAPELAVDHQVLQLPHAQDGRRPSQEDAEAQSQHARVQARKLTLFAAGQALDYSSAWLICAAAQLLRGHKLELACRASAATQAGVRQLLLAARRTYPAAVASALANVQDDALLVLPKVLAAVLKASGGVDAAAASRGSATRAADGSLLSPAKRSPASDSEGPARGGLHGLPSHVRAGLSALHSVHAAAQLGALAAERFPGAIEAVQLASGAAWGSPVAHLATGPDAEPLVNAMAGGGCLERGVGLPSSSSSGGGGGGSAWRADDGLGTVEVQVQLCRGMFDQGAKTAGLNVQLRVLVMDEAGEVLPLIVRGAGRVGQLRAATCLSEVPVQRVASSSSHWFSREQGDSAAHAGSARHQVIAFGDGSGMAMLMPSAAPAQRYKAVANQLRQYLPAGHPPGLPVYHSAVWYHCNTPEWAEVLTVRVASAELLQHLHLRIDVYHASGNAGRSRALGFTWLPLAHPATGQCVRAGRHRLLLYPPPMPLAGSGGGAGGDEGTAGTARSEGSGQPDLSSAAARAGVHGSSTTGMSYRPTQYLTKALEGAPCNTLFDVRSDDERVIRWRVVHATSRATNFQLHAHSGTYLEVDVVTHGPVQDSVGSMLLRACDTSLPTGNSSLHAQLLDQISDVVSWPIERVLACWPWLPQQLGAVQGHASALAGTPDAVQRAQLAGRAFNALTTMLHMLGDAADIAPSTWPATHASPAPAAAAHVLSLLTPQQAALPARPRATSVLEAVSLLRLHHSASVIESEQGPSAMDEQAATAPFSSPAVHLAMLKPAAGWAVSTLSALHWGAFGASASMLYAAAAVLAWARGASLPHEQDELPEARSAACAWMQQLPNDAKWGIALRLNGSLPALITVATAEAQLCAQQDDPGAVPEAARALRLCLEQVVQCMVAGVSASALDTPALAWRVTLSALLWSTWSVATVPAALGLLTPAELQRYTAVALLGMRSVQVQVPTVPTREEPAPRATPWMPACAVLSAVTLAACEQLLLCSSCTPVPWASSAMLATSSEPLRAAQQPQQPQQQQQYEDAKTLWAAMVHTCVLHLQASGADRMLALRVLQTLAHRATEAVRHGSASGSAHVLERARWALYQVFTAIPEVSGTVPKLLAVSKAGLCSHTDAGTRAEPSGEPSAKFDALARGTRSIPSVPMPDAEGRPAEPSAGTAEPATPAAVGTQAGEPRHASAAHASKKQGSSWRNPAAKLTEWMAQWRDAALLAPASPALVACAGVAWEADPPEAGEDLPRLQRHVALGLLRHAVRGIGCLHVRPAPRCGGLSLAEAKADPWRAVDATIVPHELAGSQWNAGSRSAPAQREAAGPAAGLDSQHVDARLAAAWGNCARGAAALWVTLASAAPPGWWAQLMADTVAGLGPGLPTHCLRAAAWARVLQAALALVAVPAWPAAWLAVTAATLFAVVRTTSAASDALCAEYLHAPPLASPAHPGDVPLHTPPHVPALLVDLVHSELTPLLVKLWLALATSEPADADVRRALEGQWQAACGAWSLPAERGWSLSRSLSEVATAGLAAFWGVRASSGSPAQLSAARVSVLPARLRLALASTIIPVALELTHARAPWAQALARDMFLGVIAAELALRAAARDVPPDPSVAHLLPDASECSPLPICERWSIDALDAQVCRGSPVLLAGHARAAADDSVIMQLFARVGASGLRALRHQVGTSGPADTRATPLLPPASRRSSMSSVRRATIASIGHETEELAPWMALLGRHEVVVFFHECRQLFAMLTAISKFTSMQPSANMQHAQADAILALVLHLRRTHRVDLYTTYVQQLLKLHAEAGHGVEAAYSRLLLLGAPSRAAAATPGAALAELNSQVSVLATALGEFLAAEAAPEEIAPVARALLARYASLGTPAAMRSAQRVLHTLEQLAGDIAEQGMPGAGGGKQTSVHYLVQYCGAGWPAEVLGRAFVYRAAKGTGIAQFERDLVAYWSADLGTVPEKVALDPTALLRGVPEAALASLRGAPKSPQLAYSLIAVEHAGLAEQAALEHGAALYDQQFKSSLERRLPDSAAPSTMHIGARGLAPYPVPVALASAAGDASTRAPPYAPFGMVEAPRSWVPAPPGLSDLACPAAALALEDLRALKSRAFGMQGLGPLEMQMELAVDTDVAEALAGVALAADGPAELAGQALLGSPRRSVQPGSPSARRGPARSLATHASPSLLPQGSPGQPSRRQSCASECSDVSVATSAGDTSDEEEELDPAAAALEALQPQRGIALIPPALVPTVGPLAAPFAELPTALQLQQFAPGHAPWAATWRAIQQAAVAHASAFRQLSNRAKAAREQARCRVFTAVLPVKMRKSGAESLDVWVRRVHLVTAEALPCTRRRVAVTHVHVDLLDPFNNALAMLAKKNEELWDVIQRYAGLSGRHKVENLTSQLKGVIDAAVQGGTANFVPLLTGEHQATHPEIRAYAAAQFQCVSAAWQAVEQAGGVSQAPPAAQNVCATPEAALRKALALHLRMCAQGLRRHASVAKLKLLPLHDYLCKRLLEATAMFGKLGVPVEQARDTIAAAQRESEQAQSRAAAEGVTE